ncbi:receptor-interacting serine/threonine-protein kinase 3-like isoform 1-T2 [Spinachia spinachia]
MAQESHKIQPVVDESLEGWREIGCGGFGHVYKARHKDWGFDVAIKILHKDVSFSESLWNEANVMSRASCNFVLRLYGTYEGFRPIAGEEPVKRRLGGETMQGLVMELMERGSVQSLFEEPPSPPPWPLVCRLAHQVAVGMNFLHQRDLMHHDLKPSNVLLDADLNAKLADFGLSRKSTSCTVTTRETGILQGSYKYMPPEAFEPSYQPVRSFDIYSYGILLWSIISGKEPYPSNNSELVMNGVARGDRPRLKHIVKMEEEALVVLMRGCWDHSPSKRPPFKDVLKTTEAVFSKHEQGIRDAVDQVLRPKPPISNQPNIQLPEQKISNDIVDWSPTQIQDPITVPTSKMSLADKGKYVDDNRPKMIGNVTRVMEITDLLGDMVHCEARALIANAAINPIRMRALYTSLHSGGDEVKAAFYDALAKLHPELVEKPDG